MTLKILDLKKGEDKRLREGHLWIYSNEIDIKKSALKSFEPGENVLVRAANQELLGVAYVNPHSLISGRLMTRDPKQRFNTELLSERLESALAARQKIYTQPFYRLVFGESDELPGLVLDRFGEHLVIQCNTAGMDHKKEELVKVLRLMLPTTQSILFRNDSSIRKQEGLDAIVEEGFGSTPELVRIEENDVVFDIPLWKGQKTGWFYDHRLNRSRLKEYAKGQQVLDVFSYLGGWGLQAAHHGAASVTCIDSSAFACEQILKNARLNHCEAKVQVTCNDAVSGLQQLYKDKKHFDLIILDPPAFIKKRKDQKEGLLAYQRLNALALKILRPGGILISGSCSMHLSYPDLIQLVQRAAIQTQSRLQILERGHQAPDHPVHLCIPETDYLKALILRKF